MTGCNRSFYVFAVRSVSCLTPFSLLKFSMALMMWFAPAAMFPRSISCTVRFTSNTQRPLRHSMATSPTLTVHNLILSWLTPRSIIVFPGDAIYSRCQEIPPAFVKHEGSLPVTQNPATGLHMVPYKIITYLQIFGGGGPRWHSG